MSAPIKIHKRCRQAIKLPAMKTGPFDDAVKHLALIEPCHDYKPVDDLAVAGDRKALR